MLDAENAGTLIDDRDRAESISQDKEEQGTEEQKTCTWIVQYTSVQPTERNIPTIYKRCFGPFNTFAKAKAFATSRPRTPWVITSIHTVSSV